jgi:rhodanese-related sulfurtransferase
MDLFFNRLSLSPREAFEYLQSGAAILDIRPEYETSFRVFDVPTVYYLPYNELRDKFSIIPMDIPLIIADSVGTKSIDIAQFLMMKGYTLIACLAGGIVEWDRAGLPLNKDVDYEMVGGCACRLQPQNPKVEGSALKEGSI